jgi:hypothetical protein
MKSRSIKLLAVSIGLLLISGLGPPDRARAVTPDQVAQAAKIAYEAYQLLSRGLSIDEATEQIIAAIENARVDIEAHMDALTAAELRACAQSALGDFADITRMSPDTLQAFARDTQMCVSSADSALGAVTDPAVVNGIGFAVNIVGLPILTAKPASIAVARGADGRVGRFAVDSVSRIWNRWQLQAGKDSWSPWRS